MTRRLDIDGLRTIAIALVVVFHGYPELLPGGFVGVDVFFVISGYLIGNLLRDQFGARTFGLRRFYGRRASRLLPALLLVLLATAGLGFATLFQPERRALGSHILSALRFGSNFTLMNEVGYFDTTSDLKPLLHLWSLAIEEQFYLILPLVIWWGGRHSRRWILALLALSAGLNVYFYAGGIATIFYHPLVRFWEPLAGAALAWTARPAAAWRDRTAWTGVTLIAVAAALARPAALYPNAFAPIIVLGTLLLLFAGPESRAGRGLASRAMVFGGAISYPLYLWHWPLLAYARLQFGVPLGADVATAVLAGSLALATLTHFYVERPVGRMHWRRQLSLGLAGALALVAIGQCFRFGLREHNRLPQSMAFAGESSGPTAWACGDAVDFKAYCVTDVRDAPTRAIWGDSKAGAIFPALRERSKAGERWKLVGRPQCPATADVRRVGGALERDECALANRLALDHLLSDPKIKFVLLAMAVRDLVGGQYEASDRPGAAVGADVGLARAVERLTRAGKRVGILLDNPMLQDPELCVPRPGLRVGARERPRCSQSIDAYRAHLAPYLDVARRLRQTRPDVVIVDAMESLCEAGTCRVMHEGKSQYFHTDHVSDYGGARVAPAILSQIDGALGANESID